MGCGLLPKYLALVEGELMDEDTTGLDTKLNEEKKWGYLKKWVYAKLNLKNGLKDKDCPLLVYYILALS